MNLLLILFGVYGGVFFISKGIQRGIKFTTKTITDATAKGVQKQLAKPEVQTALQTGTAVATGGASLGATAAANAATTGIRMASNTAATNDAASTDAKATGRFGRAKNLVSGAAMATAGSIGVAGKVGQKVAKDFANTDTGQRLVQGTKEWIHNDIIGPVRFAGKKVYTTAGKIADKANNTRVVKGAKRTIKGAKKIGHELVQGTQEWIHDDIIEPVRLVGEKAHSLASKTKEAVENSAPVQAAKKTIAGAQSVARMAAKYGKQLQNYIDDTADYAKNSKSNKMRKEGLERIKKALEAENPVTLKDLFLEKLHGKKSVREKLANKNNDEVGVRFTSNSATGKLSERALNESSESQTVEIPEENVYGIMPGMNMQPTTQLIYKDYSTLKLSDFDKNGSLLGTRTIFDPGTYEYSGANTISLNNSGDISRIGEYYEKALDIIKEKTKQETGRNAYSEEEGRAMAQMLAQMQSIRDITSERKIREDVMAKFSPNKQKDDAIDKALSENPEAMAAKQNYIESYTNTTVSQATEMLSNQNGGATLSEEQIEKIKEQAKEAVEENFNTRLKDDKEFRNQIFGQDIKDTLGDQFTDIDKKLEKQVNDAIAEKNISEKTLANFNGEDTIKKQMEADFESMMANRTYSATSSTENAEITTQTPKNGENQAARTLQAGNQGENLNDPQGINEVGTPQRNYNRQRRRPPKTDGRSQGPTPTGAYRGARRRPPARAEVNNQV